MKLVPIDPAKFTGQVTIDPLVTQNIGVRVSPVVTGPVTRTIRTVGSVDYNETQVRDVSLKFSGWVEKLFVNAIGQQVEQGQPLVEIYSPELFSAQEEYLLVFKRSAAKKEAGPGDAELLAAAKKRLEFFDLSAEQIKQLETSGQTPRTMTLRSPVRGIVISRSALEGQRVEAGMPLLRVADLSKLWILATVYESQLPFVAVGQKAVVTLPSAPGRTFESRVAYIYPTVNQESRQAKVRLELDNPDLALKPGLFLTVELQQTVAAAGMLVPREAVIDTGERQIAFVSLGEGRFDPRRVVVGVEAENGLVQILDGLKPGEQVVTSGEFLLDSEARLRETLAKMISGTPAASAAAPSAAATTAAPAGEFPFINHRCPIMGTNIDPAQVTPALTRDYKGHKVAFCCNGCPDQWDKLTDAERDEKLIKAGVSAELLRGSGQGH
jgi:RND family efflux transporter MFP subunit